MAQAPLLDVAIPSIAAPPALALAAFQLAIVAGVFTLVPGRTHGNALEMGALGDLSPA